MKKYTQQLNPLIFNAVNKLVDFVKVTYGPAQNKIILQRGRHQEVIDDGVETAKQFELPDEFEDSIVRLITEVAKKTNERVGDGTTGALIIAQAIMKEIERLDGYVSREVIADLQNGLEEFKSQIKEKAIPITTKEDLQKVAYISFNNERMAKVIAEILFELGTDAIVSIEESRSLESSHNIVKGLQFPRGYASHYFINDAAKAECVLEKPYILVTDQEIYDAKELVPILKKVLESGNRQIVIIADDVRGEALGTLIVNTLQAKGLLPAVRAPYYSNEKYEFLADVAELTGANFTVANTNKKLADLELSDLGSADRVVITKDHTTIVGGAGKEIESYITKMRAIAETTESDIKKDKMLERIAKLTSGVAVIKVGGATEDEMKALRYKVEDAVNATRVAYKSGVVRGAGITLAEIETSSQTLNRALQYPHRQLLKNLEVDSLEIGEDIIDPVEVLIAGVESAVSIVSLLITTKGILVDEQKDEQK